uniref:tyrosine-type recombinase/integrase n=1 Tax=Gemmiger formicilis TaxID=745368 RepID=UPI003FF09DFB
YTLIHVLMLYGIRRGECAGIKLSAVDLRGKTITICSCVMYDPKNGVYEKPYLKKRKPRQLPITPQMDEILRRYLKWRGEQPEWYGDLWQESGYLFTNEYGGPMNPDNITQYLNRMGDRLQKENPNFPHLNPHAFRHAVTSILVANGTDIVTTAAFIGDKPATVSERYAHIIDSAKIRAGDTLSSVIFGDGNK